MVWRDGWRRSRSTLTTGLATSGGRQADLSVERIELLNLIHRLKQGITAADPLQTSVQTCLKADPLQIAAHLNGSVRAA